MWLLSADVQILSTDVRLLITDIQAQLDQEQEALASLVTRMDQLLTSVESASRNTDSFTLLNAKLDELTAAFVRQTDQHQPGFCEKKTCAANCHSRLHKARADVVDLINHRLPDTIEDLRQIEVAMKTRDIGKLPMNALHLIDEVSGKPEGTADAEILEQLRKSV